MENNKKLFEFDKLQLFSIIEAIEVVKKSKTTKFDASIDIAIKLNLDTTKAEQQLRGTLILPNFFGKAQRIVVIDDSLTKSDAKNLDVLKVGGKDVIDEITAGWIDFDLIITTPKMMPALSKLGKLLGPRGLMPNPKIGNVTVNVKTTVENFKKGVSQYRTDSYGNIHMLVGRMSSSNDKVADNIETILNFIKAKRPSMVKGIFIQNISISSTMGPGVKIII